MFVRRHRADRPGDVRAVIRRIVLAFLRTGIAGIGGVGAAGHFLSAAQVVADEVVSLQHVGRAFDVDLIERLSGVEHGDDDIAAAGDPGLPCADRVHALRQRLIVPLQAGLEELVIRHGAGRRLRCFDRVGAGIETLLLNVLIRQRVWIEPLDPIGMGVDDPRVVRLDLLRHLLERAQLGRRIIGEPRLGGRGELDLELEHRAAAPLRRERGRGLAARPEVLAGAVELADQGFAILRRIEADQELSRHKLLRIVGLGKGEFCGCDCHRAHGEQ